MASSTSQDLILIGTSPATQLCGLNPSRPILFGPIPNGARDRSPIVVIIPYGGGRISNFPPTARLVGPTALNLRRTRGSILLSSWKLFWDGVPERMIHRGGSPINFKRMNLPELFVILLVQSPATISDHRFKEAVGDPGPF
ncbi:unnamed protein product [Cuscuta campestris]|uniref:Uncharacterized protein n=1 Tax=Cuscuta campestris TaxID=132261 RepID=A0A484N685_9ASTE|nr:unnamed protein product [Cuscuta campestris]